MSIQDLILTILVLVVLITLIILIATVIAQNANLDIDEVGWLTALSTVLLGMCRSCEIFD